MNEAIKIKLPPARPEMIELALTQYDQHVIEQSQRQTYGVTIGQVKQCLEWHDHDTPDYMANVAKKAREVLSGLEYGHDQQTIDTVRQLLNRICLANSLDRKRRQAND